MSVSIPLQDTDLVPDCDGNVGHLPAVLAPFCGSGLGARGAPCLAPLVSSGPWSVRGQGGEHVVHLVSGVEGQGVVFYRATAILVVCSISSSVGVIVYIRKLLTRILCVWILSLKITLAGLLPLVRLLRTPTFPQLVHFFLPTPLPRCGDSPR